MISSLKIILWASFCACLAVAMPYYGGGYGGAYGGAPMLMNYRPVGGSSSWSSQPSYYGGGGYNGGGGSWQQQPTQNWQTNTGGNGMGASGNKN